MRTIIWGVVLVFSTTTVKADDQVSDLVRAESERLEELATTQLKCSFLAKQSANLLPDSAMRGAKHDYLGMHLFQKLRELAPLKGAERDMYPFDWSDRDISFAEAAHRRDIITIPMMYLFDKSGKENKSELAMQWYSKDRCNSILPDPTESE